MGGNVLDFWQVTVLVGIKYGITKRQKAVYLSICLMLALKRQSNHIFRFREAKAQKVSDMPKITYNR